MVRSTDRPDMILAVVRGLKHKSKQRDKKISTKQLRKHSWTDRLFVFRCIQLKNLPHIILNGFPSMFINLCRDGIGCNMQQIGGILLM